MVFPFSPKRPRRLLVVAALLAIAGVPPATAASNDVQVPIDQATLVRLERPAAEIVVGNPSIADVSVQSGKVLVVTGKSFGETNLIVMDADGKVIVNRRLIVQEPRTGFVTVYKGAARQTLHCAPNCTPPLAIGDAPAYFEVISKQIKTKQRSANHRPRARSRKNRGGARGPSLGCPTLQDPLLLVDCGPPPIGRCADRLGLARYSGRWPRADRWRASCNTCRAWSRSS